MSIFLQGLDTSPTKEEDNPLIPQKNNPLPPPVVRRRNNNINKDSGDKSKYRCSLINLDAADEELDAILGELRY